MRPTLLLVTILAVAASWLAVSPTLARNHEQLRTISVRGSGAIAVTPDLVTLKVGVSTRDPSPAKALKANSAQVTKLFETLERFGVAKRDIQTSSFSVIPFYNRRRKTDAPPSNEAYDVSNNVNVRLRDLDKLGTLLDALVADGANRLNNLTFGVSDLDQRTDEARKLAIQDAKKRAELYAKEADVDVGKVLQISESSTGMPRALRSMAPGGAPIARGEQKISASVTVVFEID